MGSDQSAPLDASPSKTPDNSSEYVLANRAPVWVAKTARELKRDAIAWRARVELAAAHRLLHNWGLNEGIDNHLTSRIRLEVSKDDNGAAVIEDRRSQGWGR